MIELGADMIRRADAATDGSPSKTLALSEHPLALVFEAWAEFARLHLGSLIEWARWSDDAPTSYIAAAEVVAMSKFAERTTRPQRVVLTPATSPPESSFGPRDAKRALSRKA